MKLTVLLFPCLFCATSTIYAQRPTDLRPPADIFKNFLAMRNDDSSWALEGEGYNVVVTPHKYTPVPRNYKAVMKEKRGKKKVLKDKLNGDPLENYVTDQSVPTVKPPIIAHDYLVPRPDSTIWEIGIARYTNMDTNMERDIVRSIFYDGIYQPLLINMTDSVVDFIGRKLVVPGNWYWAKPHVIMCENYYNICWYLYPTMDEANQCLQEQLTIARHEIKGRMQDSAYVSVLFEGVPVTATRYSFDENAFGWATKGNSMVHTYFMAAEVRGRYVYCRISFAGNDGTETRMPYVLSQIMKVQ